MPVSVNRQWAVGLTVFVLMSLAACSGASLPAATAPPSKVPVVAAATATPQTIATATPIPSATPVPTTTPTRTPTRTATPTITPLTVIAVTPTASPTPEFNARVVADNGLRLRTGPGQEHDILDVIGDGTPLQVTNRTADGLWLEVQVFDGQTGWMMARYVTFDDSPETLATLDAGYDVPVAAAVPATGARVAADANGLRLRSEPLEEGDVLATLRSLAPLVVVGRTADNAWLRVATDADGVGWVWADYVDVYVDLSRVPVGGGENVQATLAARSMPTATVPATRVADLPPIHPNAQVQAGRGGLRVRVSPGTAGSELVRLDELTPLEVVGRTADNTWLEVITPEHNKGWVWARYVEAATVALNRLPVTGQAVDLPTPVPGVSVAMAGGASSSAQGLPAAGETGFSSSQSAAPAEAPMTGERQSDIPIRPVISGISARAGQIFQQGQQRGNRANVFSKVGDSITDVEYFLLPVGARVYSLGNYDELEPVIQYYQAANARDGNSFSNRSLAAYSGWTTDDVLRPGNVPVGMDGSQCRSNESPLVCEYRVVRPAVALIMLGTNDVHHLPVERYRVNLAQIVETSIDMGVIPVLSTIPTQHNFRSGTVDLFNTVIVSTAETYQIPLWDYWGAMHPLPEEGLSADGAHPSVPPGGANAVAVFTPENLGYGYTIRNLTALQVLDAIWRQVLR